MVEIIPFQIILVLILEIFVLRSFYVRLKNDEPDRYFSLSEMSTGRNPLVYYFKYSIFRIIPAVIISLVNYRILAVVADLSLTDIYYFNFAMVLSEALITNLRGYSKYRGLNLASQHLIFACIFSTSPYFAKVIYQNFSSFVPTLPEIISNLWMAVIVYGVFSSLGYMNKSQDENREDYSIFTKELLKQKIQKHEKYIDNVAREYNADSALVKAVAIYEILQRPSLLRLLERVFVFLTRTPATQGVMQYMAPRIISDNESIALAVSHYFKETDSKKLDEYDMFYEIISKYNFSPQYIYDVYTIYKTIK